MQYTLKLTSTSTGCPWINELGSLNDHLETCGYVLVLCSNGCKRHIVRDKHLLHCAEECPLRKHMCEHCKAVGPATETQVLFFSFGHTEPSTIQYKPPRHRLTSKQSSYNKYINTHITGQGSWRIAGEDRHLCHNKET